jgi:hypothetical protein
MRRLRRLSSQRRRMAGGPPGGTVFGTQSAVMHRRPSVHVVTAGRREESR